MSVGPEYLSKEGFGFEVFDFKKRQQHEGWFEYSFDLLSEIIFNLLMLPLLILMAPAIIGSVLWERYRDKHPKRPDWMREHNVPLP